ncbi:MULTISPECIES: YnfU family zinc-binding protein [Erwiniaceae]|uniref:YnfU family zinc-binding protein n=1 Tax=Erwiniaceae TaxID=1903409 RepID=UPI001BD0B85D|nr:YnfU family zinc-binding protein [Erwinia rhapontici]
MAYNQKQPKSNGFLISIACPKCSKNSDHSAPRVHKNKNLLCPFCSVLFTPSESKI